MFRYAVDLRWTIHLYCGGEWTAMLLLLCTASLAPSLALARNCLF
jgi:hypothetical protein